MQVLAACYRKCYNTAKLCNCLRYHLSGQVNQMLRERPAMLTRRTSLTIALVVVVMAGCLAVHAAPGTLEVHVSASPATVVLMSGPQVKAISLVPEGVRGCLLQNIEPGDYTLAVSAPMYVSVSRAVTVHEGTCDDVWVQLVKFTRQDFAARGRIVGTVKDADGNPVVNAVLVLISAQGPLGSARPVNDDGIYELEWYPPGTYSVIAVAPGFKQATYKGLKVSAGAKTWLDVVLQAQ